MAASNESLVALIMIIAILGVSLVAVNPSITGFATVKLCVDSDGGKVYDVKGTTTFTKHTDGILKTTKVRTDLCLSKRKVKEFFCKGNSIDAKKKNCPTGASCIDGACVHAASLATAPVCTDSDTGIVLEVRGTTKGLDSRGRLVTQKDACRNDGKIRERYCEDNIVTTTTQRCPPGTKCIMKNRRGACKPVPGAAPTPLPPAPFIPVAPAPISASVAPATPPSQPEPSRVLPELIGENPILPPSLRGIFSPTLPAPIPDCPSGFAPSLAICESTCPASEGGCVSNIIDVPNRDSLIVSIRCFSCGSTRPDCTPPRVNEVDCKANCPEDLGFRCVAQFEQCFGCVAPPGVLGLDPGTLISLEVPFAANLLGGVQEPPGDPRCAELQESSTFENCGPCGEGFECQQFQHVPITGDPFTCFRCQPSSGGTGELLIGIGDVTTEPLPERDLPPPPPFELDTSIPDPVETVVEELQELQPFVDIGLPPGACADVDLITAGECRNICKSPVQTLHGFCNEVSSNCFTCQFIQGGFAGEPEFNLLSDEERQAQTISVQVDDAPVIIFDDEPAPTAIDDVPIELVPVTPEGGFQVLTPDFGPSPTDIGGATIDSDISGIGLSEFSSREGIIGSVTPDPQPVFACRPEFADNIDECLADCPNRDNTACAKLIANGCFVCYTFTPAAEALSFLVEGFEQKIDRPSNVLSLETGEILPVPPIIDRSTVVNTGLSPADPVIDTVVGELQGIVVLAAVAPLPRACPPGPLGFIYNLLWGCV